MPKPTYDLDHLNPWTNDEPPMARTEASRLIGAVLYAVRMPDGLIKIGWSDHLDTQVAHLPGCKMLALKAGTRADELALHRSLTPSVHHGQGWYNPTPEVMAVVNEWRTSLGFDAVA